MRLSIFESMVTPMARLEQAGRTVYSPLPIPLTSSFTGPDCRGEAGRTHDHVDPGERRESASG